MRLFLRWLWWNVAAVLVFAALGLSGFASGLSGAPLVVTVLILAVAACVSVYSGTLYWRAERPLEVACRKHLIHDADHVFYAVAVLQILGLIGAMLGYRQESHAAGLADAGTAIQHLSAALGNGLTATLCGVICSLFIWLQHHALIHHLER